MDIKVDQNAIFSKNIMFHRSLADLKALYFIYLNGKLKEAPYFSAQQMQTDKIYRKKAWEISYLTIYYITLQKCIPGSASFRRNSTLL